MYIPASVHFIGYECFYWCHNLFDVEFAPEFSGEAFETTDMSHYGDDYGEVVTAFNDTGFGIKMYEDQEGWSESYWWFATLNINGVDYRCNLIWFE